VWTCAGKIGGVRSAEQGTGDRIIGGRGYVIEYMIHSKLYIHKSYIMHTDILTYLGCSLG
jgi:hypothetical protein